MISERNVFPDLRDRCVAHGAHSFLIQAAFYAPLAECVQARNRLIWFREHLEAYRALKVLAHHWIGCWCRLGLFLLGLRLMRIGAILVFALISEVARRQLLTFLVLEFALDSVAKAVVLADGLLLLFFR